MLQNNPIEKKSTRWLFLCLGVLFALLLALAILPGWGGRGDARAQSPTPTPDRLAQPPLSDDPTQYEQGTYLYWYNCMPCHGDYGQGLTQEFIELWPEDHQNCWGRGCHGGRIEDEGFPVPKTVPAIIDESGEALLFTQPDTLFEFLKTTHPPQNPGVLPDEEYWAITAFLLTRNGLLKEGKVIGPDAGLGALGVKLAIATSAALAVLAVVLVWLALRRRRTAALAETGENPED